MLTKATTLWLVFGIYFGLGVRDNYWRFTPFGSNERADFQMRTLETADCDKRPSSLGVVACYFHSPFMTDSFIPTRK